MHEDTMQTERTRAHDASRVKNLLLVSMGLSLAAHVRSPHKPINRDMSKPSRWERRAKSLADNAGAS